MMCDAWDAIACSIRSSVEERHDSGVAVNPKPLSGLDLGRCPAGAHHGGEPVLAGHDGGVGHHSADVGDRRPDLVEDGRPARGGDRADQDLALLDRADVLDLEPVSYTHLTLPTKREVESSVV